MGLQRGQHNQPWASLGVQGYWAHLVLRQKLDWLTLGELFYYAQKFPFTSLGQ